MMWVFLLLLNCIYFNKGRAQQETVPVSREYRETNVKYFPDYETKTQGQNRIQQRNVGNNGKRVSDEVWRSQARLRTVLPDGRVQISVPISQTFMQNGRRMAYVSPYPCTPIRGTARAQAVVRMCYPRVVYRVVTNTGGSTWRPRSTISRQSWSYDQWITNPYTSRTVSSSIYFPTPSPQPSPTWHTPYPWTIPTYHWTFPTYTWTTPSTQFSWTQPTQSTPFHWTFRTPHWSFSHTEATISNGGGIDVDNYYDETATVAWDVDDHIGNNDYGVDDPINQAKEKAKQKTVRVRQNPKGATMRKNAAQKRDQSAIQVAPLITTTGAYVSEKSKSKKASQSATTKRK